MDALKDHHLFVALFHQRTILPLQSTLLPDTPRIFEPLHLSVHFALRPQPPNNPLDPTRRSLPREYLTDAAHVFLNIPMDDETPSMRLLRPQALLQEEAIRHWASTSAYRMDLAAARSGDRERVEREKGRFMRALEPLLRHEGPGVLVTDSQAMDVVHPWTVGADGKPLCDITTFSISMIHR